MSVDALPEYLWPSCEDRRWEQELGTGTGSRLSSRVGTTYSCDSALFHLVREHGGGCDGQLMHRMAGQDALLHLENEETTAGQL